MRGCAVWHALYLYWFAATAAVQNGCMPLENLPLYVQIANQLLEAVRTGALSAGAKLPSVRAMARQQGVAQSTVVQAYHWLEDAQVIAARPRAGFFVAPRKVSGRAVLEPTVSRPAQRPRAVAIDWWGQRILGQDSPADMLSFSSGTPGLDLLNTDRVRRAVVQAAQRQRNLLCTYPVGQGSEELRHALARYALTLGCSLDPANIVVTGGCMDAIALCLRAVTQPGDIVALESPTHSSFLEVLQSLHLRALEIPTHPRHGISLDALQLALDTQPVKALLVTPTLSNPLGCSMPQTERRRLAKMASEHGLAVIEDAIYNELCEFDEMRRTVKSYDTTGQVLLCHSFAKTLAPGLRLGWVEAGRWTPTLCRINSMESGAQTTVLELALAHLISQAGHALAMRQLRAAITARLAAARETIATHFPKGTRVSHPAGGLLLWLELPRQVDAKRFHAACLAENMLVPPGRLFSTGGRFGQCLRIGLGGEWSAAHVQALRRMGELAALAA